MRLKISIILAVFLAIPLYFILQDAETTLGETITNKIQGILFVIVGCGSILSAFSDKFRKDKTFNKGMLAGGILALFGGTTMIILLSLT